MALTIRPTLPNKLFTHIMVYSIQTKSASPFSSIIDYDGRSKANSYSVTNESQGSMRLGETTSPCSPTTWISTKVFWLFCMSFLDRNAADGTSHGTHIQFQILAWAYKYEVRSSCQWNMNVFHLHDMIWRLRDSADGKKDSRHCCPKQQASLPRPASLIDKSSRI